MRTIPEQACRNLVLVSPLGATAQDTSLDAVAKAMGATGVKSIQYSGSGVNFQIGQNYSPDMPWPRFVVKSYTRTVNYDTPALQDELVRLQGEDPPRGGGGQPRPGRAAPDLRDERRLRLERGRRRRQPDARRADRSTAPAVDHAPRCREGGNGQQGHGPGPRDLLRRAREVSSQDNGRRSESDREDRRGRAARRARRYPGRDPILGLQRLRRREIPDEDQADDRRAPRARADGERRPAQRRRGSSRSPTRFARRRLLTLA